MNGAPCLNSPVPDPKNSSCLAQSRSQNAVAKTSLGGACRPLGFLCPGRDDPGDSHLEIHRESRLLSALAKHILQVAPKSAKVLFENEVIRVIEITLSRGQKVPMHSHNKGFSYSLNGGRIRSTDEDGKSGVVKVKKGEFSWSDKDGAETHSVENLGGTLRELSIEFKG